MVFHIKGGKKGNELSCFDALMWTVDREGAAWCIGYNNNKFVCFVKAYKSHPSRDGKLVDGMKNFTS